MVVNSLHLGEIFKKTSCVFGSFGIKYEYSKLVKIAKNSDKKTDNIMQFVLYFLIYKLMTCHNVS